MSDIDVSTMVEMTGKARRHLSELEDVFEIIRSQLLKEAQKSMQPARASPAGTAGKRPGRRRDFMNSAESHELEAVSLVLKPGKRSRTEVEINREIKFTLSKTDAELLRILADGSGASADALVPWKSLDEIKRRLGASLGKTVQRRTVTQGIYRLREKLDEITDGNWRFIQTNPREGARFALRK